MWAVCGGFFITNFILCNYLKVLVKPVFEKPVDSSEDVVTRGLIPYMHPGTGVWKKVMAKMPDPYPLLAETMIISTSWPQFFNLSKYNTIEKESRIDHSHFFIFINGRELMPRWLTFIPWEKRRKSGRRRAAQPGTDPSTLHPSPIRLWVKDIWAIRNGRFWRWKYY